MGKLKRHPGRPASPASIEALLDVGAGHFAAGRLAQAEACYTSAAKAAPGDFRPLFSLAAIDLRLQRPERALTRLTQVVRLQPSLFAAHYNLGGAAQALSRWDQAASAYERALALAPEDGPARQQLATVLTIQGRIEAAAAHLRQLCARAQTRWWALTRLALIRPEAVSDEDLEPMQAGAADRTEPPETRAGLWFALGEVHERRGRPDAAFSAYAEGNRLKRSLLTTSPAANPPAVLQAHRDSMSRVARLFSAEFLEARRGLGLSSNAPIFVVGMPRAGSTMIEQLLARHPEVTPLGETALLPRLLETGGLADGADQKTIRSLAARYLAEARSLGWRGRGRFVDKTLENALHVGAITLMFPNAVILHADRDAMDTGLSCYRQLFAHGAETLYDLAEIGAEYIIHRQIMAHWAKVAPGRVVRVDYERLVAAPEAGVRWLMSEACGLPWRDEFLAPPAGAAAVRTASVAQVRGPIVQTSVGRWRRYEAHLAPLIAALGPYGPGPAWSA